MRRLIRSGLLVLLSVFIGLLTGCMPIDGEGRPQIEIIRALPLGSAGLIEGTVRHVRPGDFTVAVYLHSEEHGGWWTVPDFLNPVTSIGGDGSWSADPGESARAQNADVLAAFLLRSGVEAPLLGGVGDLPEELLSAAEAAYYLERRNDGNARLIEFSGYAWRVAADVPPGGAGSTPLDDSPEQVWVDPEGRLHLNLVLREGVWQGSALTLRHPLGMGLYLWRVTSPLNALDPNIVFNLSLYAPVPAAAAEGLDIEFSRWGLPAAQNAQFVVQPGEQEDSRLVFDMPPDAPTLHGIDWQRAFVNFRSTTGDRFVIPAPGDLIAEFRYNQADIPQSMNTAAHIGLGLFNGQPPSNGQPVEVVLESFAFER
jgi:hypothetical protein